jgi:hypothetical protein
MGQTSHSFRFVQFVGFSGLPLFVPFVYFADLLWVVDKRVQS